jgi:hypothetical protein
MLGVSDALMNSEGTRLWIQGFGNRIYEWNLTALRKELGAVGLDWTDTEKALNSKVQTSAQFETPGYKLQE